MGLKVHQMTWHNRFSGFDPSGVHARTCCAKLLPGHTAGWFNLLITGENANKKNIEEPGLSSSMCPKKWKDPLKQVEQNTKYGPLVHLDQPKTSWNLRNKLLIWMVFRRQHPHFCKTNPTLPPSHTKTLKQFQPQNLKSVRFEDPSFHPNRPKIPVEPIAFIVISKVVSWLPPRGNVLGHKTSMQREVPPSARSTWDLKTPKPPITGGVFDEPFLVIFSSPLWGSGCRFDGDVHNNKIKLYLCNRRTAQSLKNPCFEPYLVTPKKTYKGHHKQAQQTDHDPKGSKRLFEVHLGSQEFSKSSAMRAQGKVVPSNFSRKTSGNRTKTEARIFGLEVYIQRILFPAIVNIDFMTRESKHKWARQWKNIPFPIPGGELGPSLYKDKPGGPDPLGK